MAHEALRRLAGASLHFAICVGVFAIFAVVLAAVVLAGTYMSCLVDADFNLRVARIHFDLRISEMTSFREFFLLMTVLGGGFFGLVSGIAVLVTGKTAWSSIPRWQRAKAPDSRYAVYRRATHHGFEVDHEFITALSEAHARLRAREAYERAGLEWYDDQMTVEPVSVKYLIWQEWRSFRKQAL